MRRMEDSETSKMLEMFLDFCGLEVFTRDARQVRRLALRFKDRHGTRACLVHRHEDGSSEFFLGYCSLEEMLKDAQTCDDVESCDVEEMPPASIENVFKGCRSLEEMLVRRDLLAPDSRQERQ